MSILYNKDGEGVTALQDKKLNKDWAMVATPPMGMPMNLAWDCGGSTASTDGNKNVILFQNYRMDLNNFQSSLKYLFLLPSLM